ncbi:unnamed protein product [Rhizopus stolonifer]
MNTHQFQSQIESKQYNTISLEYSPPASPNSSILNHSSSNLQTMKKNSRPPFTASQMNSSYNDCPFEIRVSGVTPKDARTRVETQIKLKIKLVPKQKEKIHWSWLRIPSLLLAKNQSKKAQQRQRLTQVCDESSILDLEAKVISESDHTKTIQLCQGCVRRERKRAERKKNATLTSIHIQPGSKMVDEAYAYDKQRILLFSSDPLVDFSSSEVMLPTRITCYCRHHDERIGFRVWFAIKHQGNVIATGQTPPIMITDDHKMPRSETRKRSRPLQDNTELSTPYQSPVLNTFLGPWQTMIPELYVDTPYVKQVLPSHGSLIGGTRVVLLGQGFRRGLQVMFGEHRAVVLSVSPTFLVCLAPPAFEPGLKPMSIQGQPSNAVFDYYDDGFQLLGELVQQILGIQSTNLVQALSQYPANLFQTNAMGHSLLHLACHLNMYPLAHWLLSQYPAMANLQDCNGLSPLHVALGSQSTAIIHALLIQGANVFLASCLGTPLELVISLFEKHYPHIKLVPALLDSYLPWLPKSFENETMCGII